MNLTVSYLNPTDNAGDPDKYNNENSAEGTWRFLIFITETLKKRVTLPRTRKSTNVRRSISISRDSCP